MLTLYSNKMSGNCYKARLTCALLSIDYQHIEIDILTGDSRASDFLAINPLGQVPVLQIKTSGVELITLLESNAIMRYLANDSWLIPTDSIRYAQMWQWLLYEQTEVRPNIASIRFIKKFQDMPASRQDEYQQKFIKAQAVLAHLNKQLMHHSFILGDKVSLADIGLYAYTHNADEGGIDMSAYPHLQDWFKRIEKLDNHITL